MEAFTKTFQRPTALNLEHRNLDAILLFIALDFITSHIHNWALFLLWLHFFILSVWNPRVFADDARGWQCPFVLCLHPQGCLRRGVRPAPTPFFCALCKQAATMLCDKCRDSGGKGGGWVEREQQGSRDSEVGVHARRPAEASHGVNRAS